MPLNSNFDSRIGVFVSRSLVFLFCMIPQLIFGQGYEIESEMEQGINYYQNAQFNQALPHFKIVAKALSESGDDEILPVIYYLCQSCEFLNGNIGGSIPYGEKAINCNKLPSEYRIQVLRSLLSAYDELALKDKCDSTIDKLYLLWDSYKVSDIIEAIVSYYCNHEEYAKIVGVEGRLNHLNNLEASNDIDKTSNKIQMNTIYMCMAKAFSELENYNKSISYLEKCIDTLIPCTQENSTIYLMMADSYNKLGDKKAALKYQKLAIEAE